MVESRKSSPSPPNFDLDFTSRSLRSPPSQQPPISNLEISSFRQLDHSQYGGRRYPRYSADSQVHPQPSPGPQADGRVSILPIHQPFQPHQPVNPPLRLLLALSTTDLSTRTEYGRETATTTTADIPHQSTVKRTTRQFQVTIAISDTCLYGGR